MEDHVLFPCSIIEITSALYEFEIGVHEIGFLQGRGNEEGYVTHEGVS